MPPYTVRIAYHDTTTGARDFRATVGHDSVVHAPQFFRPILIGTPAPEYLELNESPLNRRREIMTKGLELPWLNERPMASRREK